MDERAEIPAIDKVGGGATRGFIQQAGRGARKGGIVRSQRWIGPPVTLQASFPAVGSSGAALSPVSERFLAWLPLRFSRVTALLGWILAACTAEPMGSAAAAPAFTAEGIILTESFEQKSPNAIFRFEAKVSFSYSNGWWEVESIYQGGFATYAPPGVSTPVGMTFNCRRILDGIRLVTIAPGNLTQDGTVGKQVLTPSLACPAPFPPIEQLDLFVPWLSLCPNPELPIISETEMRRFGRSELAGHPEHRGKYTLRYLDAGGGFLSELNITNNGLRFKPDGTTYRHTPPFDHGFTEMSYRVLATTNLNGLAIPMRSVLYRFSPRRPARSRDDLYAFSVTWLDVTSVNSAVHLGRVPPRMVALDSRPPNLKVGVTANYLITNDDWMALTNPRMVRIAKISARQQPRAPQEGHQLLKRGVITVFIAVSVSWPVIAHLRTRSRKKQQNKPMQN